MSKDIEKKKIFAASSDTSDNSDNSDDLNSDVQKSIKKPSEK